jgi:1,4-dihydroxy-2-naphthoyl-CoA hydrolase
MSESQSLCAVLDFQVAFDDADGEGIVFFGNYFRLAHRALEAILPQWELTWHDWFQHPDYGAPLRHAQAEYLKPLRPGDLVRAQVRVARLGESSVELTTELLLRSPSATSEATLVRAAVITTTHVFVDRKLKTKTSIPSNIRNKLARQLVG